MMMWIAENTGKYKSKELLVNDITGYLILIKMISSISNVYLDGYAMLILCAYNAILVPFETILSPWLVLKAYRRSGKPKVS
jgi:hypothetical protein